ncbi:hypothetical protein ACGFK1_11540 [Mycobacterium sp. NPDC048908]|uniref:hypothetical protein n=1 Tax=Mycobacterium sp. NPDC048908 TaxID=3364292 RepID=UPI003720833F
MSAIMDRSHFVLDLIADSFVDLLPILELALKDLSDTPLRRWPETLATSRWRSASFITWVRFCTPCSEMKWYFTHQIWPSALIQL